MRHFPLPALLLLSFLPAIGCQSVEDRFMTAVYHANVQQIEQLHKHHPRILQQKTISIQDPLRVVGGSTEHGDMAAKAALRLVSLGVDPTTTPGSSWVPDWWQNDHDEVFEVLVDQANDPQILDLLLIRMQQALAMMVDEMNLPGDTCGRYYPFTRFNQANSHEILGTYRRRIASLRNRGAGTSGQWPAVIAATIRALPRANPPHQDGAYPSLPGPGYWGWHWDSAKPYLWQRGGQPHLLLITGWREFGPNVFLFDTNLRLVQCGIVWPGDGQGLVEFRSSDPRLPDAVRDRWHLGVADKRNLFGPLTIAQDTLSPDLHNKPHPLTFTLAPGRFGQNDEFGYRVQPIDWFGDGVDLQGLPIAREEWRDVEFRIADAPLPKRNSTE